MAHAHFQRWTESSKSPLFEAVKEFEILFTSFHGNEIDKAPRVIERFHSLLEQKYGCNWPSEVLLLYSRVRTFIRIKALNYQLKLDEANAKIRDLKQKGQFLSIN